MLRTYHLHRLSLLCAPKLSTPAITAAHNRKITRDIEQNTRCTASANYSTLLLRRQVHLAPLLQKYIKKSSQDETDSEDENDPEFKDERYSKVVKAKVNSLRADLLLKSGMGLARNKVETIFYESKVRVNGKKLPKKSVQLNIGDEIDIIRGFSQANPSHLVIARVVILSASEREEGLSVSFRRYKSLLVDNYSGINAFKSSETNLFSKNENVQGKWTQSKSKPNENLYIVPTVYSKSK